MKFAGRQRGETWVAAEEGKEHTKKKPKLNRTIFRNELLMRESINRRSREYGAAPDDRHRVREKGCHRVCDPVRSPVLAESPRIVIVPVFYNFFFSVS